MKNVHRNSKGRLSYRSVRRTGPKWQRRILEHEMVLNNSESLNAVATLSEQLIGSPLFSFCTVKTFGICSLRHLQCQFSFVLFLVNMGQISINEDVAVEDHGGFAQLRGNKWVYSLKDSFVYPHSSYLDSGMIFQMLRSLFIVTHYKFGPIRSNYQVHLVSNWLHVGWVFYYLLLHRAGEIQLARNSSPRLHFSLSVWSLSCGCRVKFSTQSWSPLPSSLVSFLGTVTDVSHSTKNAGNYGWGIGFSGVTICAWFRCTLYDFGILGVRPNKHTLR